MSFNLNLKKYEKKITIRCENYVKICVITYIDFRFGLVYGA
jgi:hypothetical protein